MFITRKKSVMIVAPLVIAGALTFTGCSASPAPSEDAGESTSAQGQTEEENTDFTVVTEDTIMTGNEELDAQLAELSKELKSQAADGISHIMINAYGADQVGIQVWTDDADGILTGAQLKPVLDAIASFEPVEPIGAFQIDGWDAEGMQGEANGAAIELGVKAEYIDSDWWNVKIPGDQVANIFG
jgi:hypothetical protein